MILAPDRDLRAHGRGGFPLEEQYALHSAALHRYAARRLGTEVAEDITAQVFVEALESWGRFDPGRGSVKTWLFAIATNVIRKHRDREHRILDLHARSGVDPIPSDPGTITTDRITAEENWAIVAGVLRDLNPVDREILLLHCWADLSFDDISASLGLPVGTVGSKMNRVRAKLRAELGDAIGGDAP